MDNIMNNPFLIKCQRFGQKIGENKFISALQAGMMGNMAVIMVGAVFTILCNVLVMFHWLEIGDDIYNMLFMPYRYTMELIGVWTVMGVSYNYAKMCKLRSPLATMVSCTAMYLMLACGPYLMNEAGIESIQTVNLSAIGMFPGFLIAFCVVRIEKFCVDKKVRIRMPDVCPPSLQNSFNAILPLFFSVVLLYGGNIVIKVVSNGTYDLFSGITAVLAAPLGALTSTVGMFIVCGFAAILWCFGIHGTMIILSVLMPPTMEAITNNIVAFQTGGYDALQYYPVLLMGMLAACGGSGNTLPLCLMGLRAKSEQIRAISKVSLIPGWFGINEPVTFGMPIMYNPILMIPFVLNVLVVGVCYYIGFQTRFLLPAFIMVDGVLPLGFGGFLGTLRWQNFVFEYLMIIPAGIVWYPFFKIYDKQLAEKEAAEKEAAQKAG